MQHTKPVPSLTILVISTGEFGVLTCGQPTIVHIVDIINGILWDCVPNSRHELMVDQIEDYTSEYEVIARSNTILGTQYTLHIEYKFDINLWSKFYRTSYYTMIDRN